MMSQLVTMVGRLEHKGGYIALMKVMQSGYPKSKRCYSAGDLKDAVKKYLDIGPSSFLPEYCIAYALSLS